MLWFLGILLLAFYLLVMPILVIGLLRRVKRLEQGGIRVPEGIPVVREQKRVVPPSDIPKSAEAPSATLAVSKRPIATSQKPVQSFEEKLGGHWFQWIGIGALVLALLFFLKWSFDNGLIGPTGRTVLGYVFAGCAMLAGDKFRTRYGTWSLAFTGGGALGAYIVTWIALHQYQLFPSILAFALYILITAVTCLLAGYYGAKALAAFGIIGGFLTPFLTDVGGSIPGILTYILILDLGILLLGHLRQWRSLNALGLLGTGLYEVYAYTESMGSGSGGIERSYALAFLAAFFVIYCVVPFIYNLLKSQKSEAPDIFILIGNAVFHFGLILAWLSLTPGLRERYDALIALGMAALFLVFSSEVYRRNRADTPIVLGSLSLTVLFASIAIPLQFGGAWVPLAWSIEGSFLLWMALELKDSRIQSFAWITMVAAYIWYFLVPSGSSYPFEGGAGSPVAFMPQGMYLFIFWAILMATIASFSFSREDREDQHVVPFIFVGLAVLAASLCLNVLPEFEYNSSLTALQRFVEAAALIGGGYVVLLQARRQWDHLTLGERRAFSGLGIAVQIVTLMYLTSEFVRAVDSELIFTGFARPWQMLQVGISILWAVYAAVVLVIGMSQNWRPLRLFSLGLLLISIVKLALVDFFDLGTGARVIGFTILGGLLIAASILYQHNREKLRSLFIAS